MKFSAVLVFGAASLLFGCDLTERAVDLAQEEEREGGAAEAPPASSGQPDVVPSGTGGRSPKAPPADGMIKPVEPVVPSQGAPMSFAELATRTNPGVVFVRTIQSQRRGFQRVLGGGSGSGFIFDPAGKILTNHHVIEGAHAIQVELMDGRAYRAEVVGADPLTDLAVLQVPAERLPALPFGDSETLRVGDWVIAIGNPFGLEHTVSAGIISAKERTGSDVKLGKRGAYYSFLQTDASINPGNSGGPLLDLSGRVVGINTAINAAANNIGFAIPIQMIKELLPRLLKEGKVRRAAIGVVVDDVTRDDVHQYKLEDRKGAFIAKVIRGGPAGQGGVQPGDVVVAFNGKPISTPEAFRWEASLAPIGEEVSLVVMRAGKRTRLSLTPVEMARFTRPR